MGIDSGPQTVITVDESSGRLHKRYDVGGDKLATLEGCNLDEAGAWHRASPSEIAEAPPEAFCRNDFPELEGPDAPAPA